MRSAVWTPKAQFLQNILVACRSAVLRPSPVPCTRTVLGAPHLPPRTDTPEASRSLHSSGGSSSYSMNVLVPRSLHSSGGSSSSYNMNVLVPRSLHSSGGSSSSYNMNVLVRRSLHSRHELSLVPCNDVRKYSSSVHGRCPLYEASLLSAGGCRTGVGWGLSSVRCSSSSRSKKPRAPIVYSKSKMEMVRLWRGMTVTQLAAALGKDVDTMLEVLTYVKQSEPFRHRNAKVTSTAVLTQAARIAGKRANLVPNPDATNSVSSKDAYRRPPADPSERVPRPPVITIMGHVDHGKTTLLDALRKSNIVDSEYGGITQHIGAFQFCLPSGSPITVLDTPGHAAFSSMRGRGANVTDIVVLVVAADDGVMPQTLESIEHCKRADVPMVVALNKIDKPDADVNMARKSLLQAGVQLEEQGGEVQCVEISAKQGTNLPALVEAVLALAEILEVSADPKGLVEASVVEAKQLPIKGKVATCLVQRGTLRRGMFLVAGTCSCKVRTMHDEHDQEVQEAPPATPVQVAGWEVLPSAGDEVLEVPTKARQQEVIAWRLQGVKEEKLRRDKVIVEAKAQEHRQKHTALLQEKRSLGIRFKSRLNRTGMRPKESDDSDTGPSVAMLLKCDVQGSLEAIVQVLETYESDAVRLDLVTSGVGPVTQGDVKMAETFGATVFAFNVDSDRGIDTLAEGMGVPIVKTNIIYRLVEQLRDLLGKQMPTRPEEEVIGEAEVLEQFMATDGSGRKKTPVAGCRCVKGTLKKDAKFRLYRDNDLVHEGPLLSMRHVKSEVGTIGTDKECGLKFEDSNVRFQKGDKIVCYVVHQLEQESDWRPQGF